MRLRVNGVEVRVVDRIEIELDVANDGEDLIHGASIRLRGGSVTIRSGSAGDHAFVLETDRTIFFRADKAEVIMLKTHDPDPPRLPDGSPLPISAEPGSHKLLYHCPDPAIDIRSNDALPTRELFES